MSEGKNLLGSFVWYDQMSNDLPGSERFYAKVVGWTLAPNTMNDQRYTSVAGRRRGDRRPHADPRARRRRPAGLDGLRRRRRRRGLRRQGEGRGRGDPSRPDRDPQCRDLRRRRRSGRRRLPAVQGKQRRRALLRPDGARPCRLARAQRRRRRESLRLLRASVRLDQDVTRCRWARRTSTSSSRPRAARKAPCSPRTPRRRIRSGASTSTSRRSTQRCERVKSAGGKITNGPHEVPGDRWIVHALDPQGAAFALVAPKR